MKEEAYSYTTPASILVQVAEIASRYKGRNDKLMDVIVQVNKLVPDISEEVSAVISREMDIGQTTVYSFVTFYERLSVKKKGKYIVRMCSNAPCHVRGAVEVREAILAQRGIQLGETTEAGRVTVELSPCMGVCDKSPAVMINDKVYGDLTPDSARALIKRYIREDMQ
ncbi:MAG: NAD(P)H-dependent oxidoreductase subunit E [Oscillospiraceae bacterium]|nr:NAD(P)H-dependent oxidoreductase subunit E [Oscillospiraceae bacterium]